MLSLLGVPSQKITVIYNGAATVGRASKDEIESARHALDLPKGRYVLSLASLEKRKNLRATLEAWSSIHQQLPHDTWLVLSGPKADPSVYGAQAIPTDIPRTVFTGYVPEDHLAGLYSGASLFVFPSLAEGFGLPLVEAMKCGVRCVTSRSSSLPEVGGDVVDYVDPHNPSELATAILARLRQEAGPPTPFMPAIDRATLFSWDTAASRTREVLYETLSRT
jgi:glycosyltransferase involved in cell wall biosynthesis